MGAPLSLLGLAATGSGVAFYIDTLNRPDNFSRKSEYLIMSAVASTVGTLATFLGGYLTLKGIRCSTAVARCQKAEAIEALIKTIKVSPTEQGSDSVSLVYYSALEAP